MADLTATQTDFLEKYLGYSARAAPDRDLGASEFKRGWDRARSVWQQAVESVDGQVARLQAVLRASDDPELAQIAEFGLNALTGNQKVRVMAAIRDVDQADALPSTSLISSAISTISKLEGHLSSDRRIHACDTNPFGVNMNIEVTMNKALADLKRALNAARAAS